ncbi:MAG: hypothetical protein JST69_01495 [Bacteroidetes bacterium]|nr:hypothetical protein [Bacteroidota bacterium]
MSEILIARFKNKREADAATKLIKDRSTAPKLLRGSNLEDMLLGELITKAMKEKRSLPIKILKKQLGAQIKALKK